MREGDEVERRGVEDELDAHEDGDRVAARGDGEQAQAEQDRRHHQMGSPTDEADHLTSRARSASLPSFAARRAITIAPTSAMSSTSDASSNGKSSSSQERVAETLRGRRRHRLGDRPRRAHGDAHARAR